MGTIVKRGTRAKPHYYGQYKDHDGKLKMKALKGARSQEDATKALARIEGRIAEGKPAFDTKPTASSIGPLMEEWRDSLSNRNARNDKARVNLYVLPAYRDLPMEVAQKLPTTMRWMDSLAKNPKLGGGSRRHCLNLLSRFFSWAIERGYAESNPVRMIPPGKRPQGSIISDGPWIQEDETFQALYQAILVEAVRLMLFLGNKSGLRPGEAAGLTMGDFAWLDEGVIRVTNSRGGPLKEDKKGIGLIKWVPAHVDTAKVLGPWLARRRAEGAQDVDLVFPYEGGSAKPRRTAWQGYERKFVHNAWDAAREGVKVKCPHLGEKVDLTFYQACRHSFVSRSLAQGIPIEEVSAAINHDSILTTQRHYDHHVRRKYSLAIRGGGSNPPAGT